MLVLRPADHAMRRVQHKLGLRAEHGCRTARDRQRLHVQRRWMVRGLNGRVHELQREQPRGVPGGSGACSVPGALTLYL